MKPEHAAELSRTLPQARLVVLPSGHGDYIGEVTAMSDNTRLSQLTVGLIEEFLDKP